MITFELLHPKMTHDHLGYLPRFFSKADPRPAKEQAHANYAHGGGWCSMSGFRKLPGNKLKYPGDPVLVPLAQARLRDELIVFYNCSIVAIIQPDGSFEVARLN